MSLIKLFSVLIVLFGILNLSKATKCYECLEKGCDKIDEETPIIECTRNCAAWLDVGSSPETKESDRQIFRGCRNDLQNETYDKQMFECPTDKCNDVVLKNSCQVCDGVNEEDCSIKDCEDTSLSCYRIQDNSIVKRGCGIDVDCEGSSKCSLCHNGDSCNEDPPQKCYFCNGEDECRSKDKMIPEYCDRYNKQCMIASIDNRGCDFNPSLDFKFCNFELCNGGILDISCMNNDLKQTKCPEDIDQCYTFIAEDGQIHRGCFSNSTHQNECGGVVISSDNCKACDEKELCNNNRVCYDCQDCDTVEEKTKVKICQEGCKVWTENGRINRGCVEDEPKEGDELYECNDRDRCNDMENVKSCVQCKSDVEFDCLNEPEKYIDKCESTLSCHRFEETPENFDLGCGWKSGDDKCDPSIGGSDCYMCYENDCNLKRPLKCAKCTSPEETDRDCTNPDTVLCPSVNDQCFAKLTADGEERGCSDNEIPGQTCSTDLCNSGNLNIKCISCLDCAEEDNTEVISSEFFDKCFSYKDELNGKIRKGFLSTLDDDDICKTNPTNINCIICDTDNCNENDFKINCYECDNCDIPNEAIGYCYNECATWIEENKINRGCKSDIPESATEFYFCSVKNCNKQPKVGSCIQCNSETEPNCLSDQFNVDDTCEAALSCYRYEKTPENFDLGCGWKSGDDKCDPSIGGSDCYMCYENDCNLKRPLKCAECTSSEEKDKSCMNPDIVLCPTVDDECFAKLSEGEETRGCAVEEAREDTQFCSYDLCNDGKLNIQCEVCENCPKSNAVEGGNLIDECYHYNGSVSAISKGYASNLEEGHPCYQSNDLMSGCYFCRDKDFCNTHSANPLQCLKCNSSDTSSCLTGIDLKAVVCEKDDNGKLCVSFIDGNGYTIRDCATEFKPANISRPVDFCESDKCNSAVIPEKRQECLQCTSNKTESECINGIAESSICPIYKELDQCYEVFVSKSEVYRGCMSDLDVSQCKDNLKRCNICKDSACNKQYKVKNNQICKKCEGTRIKPECANEQSFTENDHPCTEEIILGWQDECYMFHNQSVVQRGCLSDLKVEEINEVVETCETPKCNWNKIYRKPERKCIKCISSDEDKKCLWGWYEEESVLCEKEVEFAAGEACFTIAAYSGDFVARDCFNDNYTVSPINSTTITCDRDGCNIKSFKTQECIKCNSEFDPECGKISPKIEPTKCDENLHHSKGGCFLRKDSRGLRKERGCASKLDEIELSACKKTDNPLCEICFDKIACSSAKVVFNILILILSILSGFLMI